jgi:cell division protein FtsB
MAWLRKKPDPISDRARALNDQIARLESQIKALDAQMQHDHSQPRLRSTALPQGSTAGHGAPEAVPPPAPTAVEPIFEEVDQDLLKARGEEAATSPDHYNELGVRKYDLPALLRRIREHFRGPSTTNPKLVSYLAAGGIQGLRPLRYEKRVARNRFIFFVVILFLALLGTLLVFLKGHR